MEINFGAYKFSDDKNLISIDKLCELLGKTYWAQNRSRERIEQSVDNSICVGIYLEGKLIGFARIITDYATIYWLCDVILDEEHRGKGLGKKLIETITSMKELEGLFGILTTRDAHKLYEKFGFAGEPENLYMRRQP